MDMENSEGHQMDQEVDWGRGNLPLEPGWQVIDGNVWSPGWCEWFRQCDEQAMEQKNIEARERMGERMGENQEWIAVDQVKFHNRLLKCLEKHASITARVFSDRPEEEGMFILTISLLQKESDSILLLEAQICQDSGWYNPRLISARFSSGIESRVFCSHLLDNICPLDMIQARCCAMCKKLYKNKKRYGYRRTSIHLLTQKEQKQASMPFLIDDATNNNSLPHRYKSGFFFPRDSEAFLARQLVHFIGQDQGLAKHTYLPCFTSHYVNIGINRKESTEKNQQKRINKKQKKNKQKEQKRIA